jgi:hypothetical protein
MEGIALKTQINQLRRDMMEMRGHLDEMIAKMNSFVGLASRTAEEADSLARTLTNRRMVSWRPTGIVPVLLIGIAATAVFSPRTLDQAWGWIQQMMGGNVGGMTGRMTPRMGGTTGTMGTPGMMGSQTPNRPGTTNP